MSFAKEEFVRCELAVRSCPYKFPPAVSFRSELFKFTRHFIDIRRHGGDARDPGDPDIPGYPD